MRGVILQQSILQGTRVHNIFLYYELLFHGMTGESTHTAKEKAPRATAILLSSEK